MNRFLLASLLLLAQGPSFAAGEVYGGVGGGFSFLEIDGGVAESDGLLVRQDISGSDFSARAYLGIRYGRFLGLEIGYTDFGTVNDDVPYGASGFLLGRVNASVDTTAVDAFIVGYYPLSQDLSLLARIGVVRWDLDYELSGSASVPPFFVDFPSLKNSDDGTDLAYGLGAEYRATPRVKLRVDLQYYDLDITDDLWTLTASLKYGIPFGR